MARWVALVSYGVQFQEPNSDSAKPHPPSVVEWEGGKIRRVTPTDAWAKIGTSEGWPTQHHPLCTLAVVTSTYLCYTQQPLKPVHNVKEAAPESGTVLNQNGQMGRTCQLWCPISGTKLWQCKTTPIWVIWPMIYPLAAAQDDSDVLDALDELFDRWRLPKHLAHFVAFSGSLFTSL